MATLRDIKRKIKATTNMQQITRAMEAVSASKMRKSQMVALAARPYSVKALEMLGNLEETTKEHWLFLENESSATAILVVTSDKGLCAGYNSAVLKKVEELARARLLPHGKVDIIAVGKKAIKYLKRRKYEISAEFIDFGDYIEVEETSPVARLIMDRFKKGKYCEVWVAYTNFTSTLKQESVVRRILPIDLNFIKEIIEGIVPEYGKFAAHSTGSGSTRSSDTSSRKAEYGYEYKLEPSPKEIFRTLIPSLFEVAIHHIILESNASEHSARMVAMRNASENASEILDELTLFYNKVRQAGITKELLEVVAGKEALEV